MSFRRRTSYLVPDLVRRDRVVLVGDGERDLLGDVSPADDDHVLPARSGAHVVDPQVELENLVIAGPLVAEVQG